MYDYKQIARIIEDAQKLENTPMVARDFNIEKIRRIYKELWGYEVVRIDKGYKGYRYLPHILYNVYDKDGKLIISDMTTQALGRTLVAISAY